MISTMSRICKSVLVVLCAMAALFFYGADAQERPRPVIRNSGTPLGQQRNLEKVHAEFRRSIITAMQEAARQAGVKIRTDNFVAIPFDDSSMVFVNAMIEGADRVSINQLAQGADVLFIYSGAKLGSAGREIEPGFYVVRVSQNPASGQWLAQFKNSQGRIVLETDATVERPDSNAAKMQPMCTLGRKGELILFDEHDPFKNMTIPLIPSRLCRRCVPIFDSESRKLRQAAKGYLEYLAKNNVEVASFIARYSNFAPVVSIPAGQDIPLPSGRMSVKCEEVFSGNCVRVIHCSDDEGHSWGILLSNPACADVPPLILH